MARQAVLERLGWRFVRIRGSNFFRDPEKAMKPVFDRLEQEGITRSHDTSTENNEDNLGKELKERVIRRAQELRIEWLGQQNFESGNEDKEKSKKNKSKEFSSEKNNFQDKPIVTEITQVDLNLDSIIENKTKEQSSLDYVMSKPSTDWDMFSQWVVENAHFTSDKRQLLKNVAERLTSGLDISEQEATTVKNLHERAVNNLRYKQK